MWSNPKPDVALLCVTTNDQMVQSNVVPHIFKKYNATVKNAFSALNGRWISYSEFYTDGYWNNHPRGNMGLYTKNFGRVSDWLVFFQSWSLIG